MKRYCLRLVLVLLLTLVGVVVGTGIAIGELYATVGNAAIQNDRRFRADDWSFTMYETWGGENVTAHYNADRGPRDTVTEITHRHLQDWTRLHRLAPVPEGVDVNAMEYAFSWPFRWLCFGFRMDSEPETYEQIRELSLDTTSVDPARDDGLNPRIRWLDLFATIAIWLGIWLVLFFAWSTVRTVGRLRRHHCIECGYDLRAATMDRCSECGRDITDARRLVRRQLWTLGMLFLLCAITIPVPFLRDAYRTQARFGAWEHDEGWLDDIVAGREHPWLEDDGEDTLARIHAINGHAEQIARRIPAAEGGDELNALANLVNELARLNQEDEYLPLIDQLLVRAPELRLPGWPLLGCLSYPFPKVAERVLGVLESSDNPDLINAAMTIVRVKRAQESPWEYDERIEQALRRCLTLDDHPRVRLRTLSALSAYDFMTKTEVAQHLDDLLRTHPSLAEEKMVEELRNERSADDTTGDG